MTISDLTLTAKTKQRKLGTRLASLSASGTMEVGRKVRELRATGHDIIHLGAGIPTPAPDFLTQPIFFDPSCNFLGDPAGDSRLRLAIANRVREDQDLVYDPETEIVISAGAKQAVYATLLALINLNDEVLTMDPAWVTYAPSISLAGGSARLFTLDQANGFRLDGDKLAEAISPSTGALVVNTPHNPTGRVFRRDELDALATLALEYDLWVVSDESFDKFVYDGNRHVSIASLPGMRDRTVVVKSFSKAYGFIGGRVGYLMAPAPVASLVRRFNEQVLSCVSPFMQELALRAIEEEPGWSQRLVAAYLEKRDTVVEAIDRMEGISCAVPEGTFYVWADVSGLQTTGDAFAAELLEEAGVAVTPGSAFGRSGEDCIRFNLAGPLAPIKEGLERISHHLSQRPAE